MNLKEITTIPKVAIVIVNYNGKKYLEPLFNSLHSISYPKDRMKIFIVDNNSTDDSKNWLKQNLEQIILIENEKNEGFTGGNNIGIAKAIEWGTDYVYLLNQDTEVDPDFLFNIVQLAETNEKIGSAQSFIKLHPEVDQVNTIGNSIHFLGFGFCESYKEGIEKTLREIEYWKKHDSSLNIAYGSGAGVLYRISALKETGLFDRDLFLYHEDLDLGWRLRLFGYQNVLVPDSIIYHKYEFSRSIQKYYWMERNRFIVMFQNYKILTLLLILPGLVLMEMGLLFFSFIRGWWREKLKVYKYFLNIKNWKNILQKRERRQGERRVSDKEILKYFVGKIEFQDIKNPLLTYVANPLLDIYWKIVKKIVVW